MPADLPTLMDDLEAETAVVTAMLRPLAPADYDRATPAEGWAIRDQVSHLAYFDESATAAATDPEQFEREAAALMARGTDFADVLAGDHRSLEVATLLPWFERARADLLRVYRGMDARDRIPWYGPSMSAASCVTARLMETWAHGQDIADTLGVERKSTVRLRHIAELGIRTMAFSFSLHDQPTPTEPVAVRLRAPDGSTWSWHEHASDRVTGTALDFCLVVTQRRPVHDTDLEVQGSTAQRWMEVAQAFAGPPGKGRLPTGDRG